MFGPEEPRPRLLVVAGAPAGVHSAGRCCSDLSSYTYQNLQHIFAACVSRYTGVLVYLVASDSSQAT